MCVCIYIYIYTHTYTLPVKFWTVRFLMFLKKSLLLTQLAFIWSFEYSKNIHLWWIKSSEEQHLSEIEIFQIMLLTHTHTHTHTYIYIYIYTYRLYNYKCHTCFCPHFSWAELKDLRLFLCTQKAYFSQILFTNLSKSVLVSTFPLPR